MPHSTASLRVRRSDEPRPARAQQRNCDWARPIEGSVVHVEDVTADTDYEMAEAQQAGQFRTLLGVPLLRHGTPIGAMALGRRAVPPFTEKQIPLLRTFADQAVIAIENARLFEEVQARTRELQEALEYQTATGEVLSVISRAPSQLEPVFEAIVQTAARLCQADWAIVCTRGEDELYHYSAVSGHSEEVGAVVHKRPLAADRGSVSGRAVLERRTVQIHDALADPEFTRFDTQAVGQFRTLLGVPLLREGTPIGVISMQRRRVEPFTEKQIDLVTTFADQAVIAIENARLFEEVQARTRELSEALEQQTATSEVLDVISRSLGQIEPVFQSMLANAMRICEAQCGVMFSLRARHVPGDLLLGGGAGIRALPAGGEGLGPAYRHGPNGAYQATRSHPATRWRTGPSTSAIRADGRRDLGGLRTFLIVPMLRTVS